MSLYMEEEGGTALGLDAEKIAASVMDAALEYANCRTRRRSTCF